MHKTLQDYANLTRMYLVVWEIKGQNKGFPWTEQFELHQEAFEFLKDNVPECDRCIYRYIVSPKEG